MKLRRDDIQRDLRWDADYYAGRQQGRAEYDDGSAVDESSYNPDTQPHTPPNSGTGRQSRARWSTFRGKAN